MTTTAPARPRRGFSFASLHPAVLVVPITVLQIGFAFGTGQEQDEASPANALTVALILGMSAALVFRRRYPEYVLMAVYVLMSAYFVAHNPYGPVFFSLVFALFNAGAYGRRPVAWPTCYVGALAMFFAMMTSDSIDFSWFGATGVFAWISLLMGAGEIAKTRRERAEQVEVAREEHVRRQASEERLKIAREVHDVLAHHVSLINVQSGVALHLIDEQPEQVREALTAIKQSSKEVLVELRNILGVLKDVDRDGPPRQPVASLDQLDRLVERMRQAGLPVTVEVHGDRRSVPSGVDAAALRIVQESLTNTYRHAGPASATVALTYLPGELRVRIDDDGRGGTNAVSGMGSGNGLAGMRQRAEALTGTLDAGPRPGGGYRVTATLPTGPNQTGDET